MTPLISCIMPTTGKRRRFVEQAIKLFNAQDYPNKELVIVDETDRWGDIAAQVEVVPIQRNIRYVVLESLAEHRASFTVGAKRNLACSLAKGEIICHWDDDDYFGPERLSKQVSPILAGEADVTGMYMSLLLRMTDTTLWTCSTDMHYPLFFYGIRCGTLMYDTRYLHSYKLRYDNVSHGEDVHFLGAMIGNDARLVPVTDPASYICVRHADNVTEDIAGIAPPEWQQVPLEDYLTPEYTAFYQGMTN